MRARVSAALLVALMATALFAAGAVAARHKGGHSVYRGKTTQGKPIRIAAAPGRITLLNFGARLLCRDGSVLYANAAGFEATRLKGGRFSDVQYGKGNVVSWKGKARAAKIAGFLRITARLKSGVHCDSKPVRFVAKRGSR